MAEWHNGGCSAQVCRVRDDGTITVIELVPGVVGFDRSSRIGRSPRRSGADFSITEVTRPNVWSARPDGVSFRHDR